MTFRYLHPTNTLRVRSRPPPNAVVSQYLKCTDPVERQSLADSLFKKMLIAHGSTPQLVIEQMGVLKEYNFWRVKQAKKSLGGGMSAYDWLILFSQALEMGENEQNDSEEKPDTMGLAEALNVIARIMGQELRIFLDLKSR